MMEADILLFMGQSNMAGRGDDQLAPKGNGMYENCRFRSYRS